MLVLGITIIYDNCIIITLQRPLLAIYNILKFLKQGNEIYMYQITLESS